MSTTIDQRVVEMRFDNKHFEANVATTMSTLDKLKSKLNFTDSAKGLQNLGNYVNKIDFSGFNSAVDTVHVKLSAINVAMTMGLVNAMNSVTNAAEKMVKSLTIEPISAGFSEYELKMGSVQTIMAGTGESIEVVNKYLEELNEYSDKTIYSFSDMTENIGKFTNAGVKLKDAVAAIKGVSNVAAISGANANEASRAMYNFAQALSTGSVKLIDWKSIENANMATVSFKEELMATAVEMGTLVKVGEQYKSVTTDNNGKVSDLFTSTMGFNDALSSQWMTTEVLTKTLSRYADETTDIGKRATEAATQVKTFSQLVDTLKESAQSGWAVSWELIFGDFYEGIELWTKISNVVGEFIDISSDARNAIIKDWKAFGGRTALFEGLIHAFDALTNVVNSARAAFAKVFPEMSGEGLALLSYRIKAIMEGFSELTKRNMPKIQKSFEAFFTVVKAVGTVVGGVLGIGLKALVVVVALLSQGVIDVSEGIADVILNFKKWVTQNETLNKILNTTVAVIAAVVKGVISLTTSLVSGLFNGINIVRTLAQEFKNLTIVQTIMNGVSNVVADVAVTMKYFFGGIIGAVVDLFHNLANLKNISFESVAAVFMDFGKKIKDVFEDIELIFTTIKESFEHFGETVEDSFTTTGKTVDKLQGKFVTFATIVRNCLYSIGPAEVFAVGFGVALIHFLRKFTLAVNKITKPVSSFTGVLDKFGGVLESIKWSIKASALTSAATAITMMAVSLVALAKLCTPEELATPIATILLLGGALTAFSKFASKFDNVDKFMYSILSMAGSVLILVGAMKILETINPDRLEECVNNVAGLVALLGSVAIALAKWAPAMATNSVFMVAFSGAVLMLSLSMARLAAIDETKVTQGMSNIIMIAAGLGAVAVAVNGLSLGSAAGILLIAGGIYALMKVVETLGAYNMDEALGALGVLLSITIATIPLFLTTQLAGKYAAGAGVALLGMGVAFAIMIETFERLSAINTDNLAGTTGCIFMVMVAMAGLVAATKFARKTALQAGVMLMEMAAAMLILTASITLLSHLDAWGLVKATAVIVAIMKMMSLIIESTGYAKECKSTLIIIATVMGLMVASIGVLAMLPPGDLALATASVVGVLGVFALVIKSLEVLNKVKVTAPKALAALVGLNLVLVGIGGFLYALQYFNVAPSIETVASISLLLLAMAGTCAILSLIAPQAIVASAALVPLAKMLALTGGVVAVIGVLAGLMGKYLPEGTEAAIDRGLGIIKAITFGIGEILGSVIGGFGEGIFSGLTAIGESLSSFMTAVNGFITGVQNINKQALDGTKNLCSILIQLDSISLLTLGGSAKEAFQNINDVNIDGVVNTINSIARLSDSIPKLQRLINWFAENNLNKLKSDLNAFGSSMVTFANTVSGFPADAVMATNAIGQTLTALQNGIEDNVVFTGDVNLEERGKELAKFGAHLYSFYDKVSGVNAGQLGNVMTGLDSLTSAVKNLGTVDEGTMETFRQTFVSMGKQAILAFTETFRNAAPQVSQAVNGLLGSISSAMSGNAVLLQAMGQTAISNMIIGFENMKQASIDAMHKVCNATWFDAHSFYDDYQMTGKMYVQGIINGMYQMKKAAANAGEVIGKTMLNATDETLGIHSPAWEGIYRGIMTVLGLEQGVESELPSLGKTLSSGLQEKVLAPMSDIEAKAKESGAGILSGFTDSLYESIVAPAVDYIPELKTMFGEVSTTIADAAGIDTVVGSGVTETVNELASALDSAGASSSGLTSALGGTSSGAKSLSSALNKTTKKKKEIKEKTYEATTALEKYMERLYKESDQYKKDTESLTAYREELAELQKQRDEMQKKLEDDTEGRIKLSKEEKEEVTADLEELEDTIYSKQESINNHLETMCDNAKQEYDNLKNSIKDSIESALDFSKMDVDPGFDWFSEFKMDEDVTSESILENMKSQYKGVEKWMNNLEKLSNRKDISEGLLRELREMGVSGAAHVKAFVQMSNAELKKASKYFDEGGSLMSQHLLNGMKQSFADVDLWKESLTTLMTTGLDQRIIEKLAAMGTDSKEYIDALLRMDSEQLQEFATMYGDQLTLPESAANDMMDSFVNAGTDAANAFIDAVNAAVGTDSETKTVMVEGAQTLGATMTAAVQAGIDSESDTVEKEANTVASSALKQFEKHLSYREGKEIGQNICEGLEAGIRAGKSGVIDAAVEVAYAAYRAACAALDINSPSGMFESVGRFSDIGLIKGFLALKDKVATTAASVGIAALDGMVDVLSSIGSAVDGEFDFNPTITPIVDLTNIEESAARIGGLFNSNQSVRMAVATQSGINASISARNLAEEAAKNVKGDTTIKFEQNIHSPTALSRIDIYRQTKNQFTAAKDALSNI